MYFSEYFGVNKERIREYGAVDISLVADLPLFIDPILLYSSDKEEYKKLHKEIIKFFTFLFLEKKRTNKASSIKRYIKSSEVKNNWLGFSRNGNEGNGLGKEFVNFLSENVEFIFDDTINDDAHYEKVLLLYDKTGRDKISDLTTNLIFDYLASYTEKFAIQNVSDNQLEEFKHLSQFDYDKKIYKYKKYKLPYIYNEKGVKEFVLLTPKDILRVDEPAICRRNLMNNFLDVCETIENDDLRCQINNIIFEEVNEYKRECELKKEKEKRSIIKELKEKGYSKVIEKFPEIYNLFVKYIESKNIIEYSEKEVNETISKLCSNGSIIFNMMQGASLYSTWTSTDELAERIKFMKHKIEHEDVYKVFYDGETPLIKDEKTLQLLFKLTWHGTAFDFNSEGNNGGGEYDFKVSKGAFDKCIGEFKLASNKKLYKIFKQVEQYENASACLPGTSVYAIFGFSKNDEEKFKKLIKDNKAQELIDKRIFYIDCRKDNKISASNL